jgi:hypothetical protein
MTVITDASSFTMNSEKRCSFCGNRYVFYPYIEWHGYPEDDAGDTAEITICKHCCQRYGKGLHADIMQVNAICELERLYPGFTFVRTTRAENERKAAREAQQQEAQIAQVAKHFRKTRSPASGT